MEEKPKTPQMSGNSTELEAGVDGGCEVVEKENELEKVITTLREDIQVPSPEAEQEYPEPDFQYMEYGISFSNMPNVVAFEGSEMEKLFSTLRNGIEISSPVVERENSTPKLQSSDLNISYEVKFDDDFFEISEWKELLISCGLMLDKDRAILVNDYPGRLVSQSFFKRLNNIIIPGCCVVLGFSCYRLMKSFDWPVVVISLSTLGFSICLSLKLPKILNLILRLKNGLRKLLEKMAEISQFIKKTAATIKEKKANMDDMIALCRRNKGTMLMDLYYTQMKADIEATYLVFLKFIVQLILYTRNGTRIILCLDPNFAETARSLYMAYQTDEELGLPSLDDDACPGNISLSMLDELCDKYIAMQSEYLRVLGTSLCSSKYYVIENIIPISIIFHQMQLDSFLQASKISILPVLYGKHPESGIPCEVGPST